jgi:hypothetical protein
MPKINKPVTTVEEKGPIGGTVFTHPSFCMVRFTRINSNAKNEFFGSDLQVSNFIELSVDSGEKRKDLSRDWYYSKDALVRIRMTESQFATLITTLNSGSGTPASLSYIKGDEIKLPRDYQKHVIDEYSDDAEKRMMNAKKSIDKIVEELKSHKGNMSKSQQQTLLSLATNVQNEIIGNMKFVMSSFQEKMDTIISNAKTEVEAFTEGVISRTGIAALKESITLKMLEGKAPK